MVKLLTEIRLIDATKKDIARAINHSMKKSKRAANTLVGQLDLHGAVTPKTLNKIYSQDTFNYDTGRLSPKSYRNFADNIKDALKIKKPAHELNLMDFSNAIVKLFSK